MNINIKELRQLAVDCYWPTSPVSINELLDHLEETAKDIALKERVIDSLGSALNAAANERDALLAKIEEMEKQEPVVEVGKLYMPTWCGFDSVTSIIKRHGLKIGSKLYLAPGAKGE